MPKGYSQHNQGGWNHTEEAKEKCRQAVLDRIAAGWCMPEEAKQRMILAHLGKHYHDVEDRRQRSLRMAGENNPMYGKPMSEEAKAKASAKLKGMFTGDKNPMAKMLGAKHPNWKGGIAYLPYSADFNIRLKEEIRARDNYTCQECRVPQVECIYPLSPHHIDYDKMNCIETNLISLCQSCHSKTNYNREYWQWHFEDMIAKIYTPKGGD